MAKEKKQMSGLFKGLLVGGTIASAVSLLFAPKSGKKLRRDIRRKSKKMYRDTEAGIETAQEKASDIVEGTGERIEDIRDKTTDLIEEGQDKVDRGKRKIKESANGIGRIFKKS